MDNKYIPYIAATAGIVTTGILLAKVIAQSKELQVSEPLLGRFSYKLPLGDSTGHLGREQI